MDNIILTVPDKKPAQTASEAKPRAVQAWLMALPYTNTAETARSIYQALYSLNRQHLPAPDRFEIMELYNEPVASVVAAFQSQFARIALPLSARQKQLADFLLQIHVEMAYGYKQVIADALVRHDRLKDAALHVAIERAIRYLGQVLLRAYQVYMPYPSTVWREVHALYEFAERLRVVDETIPAPREDGDRSTIGRRYKQALLLGLSNPYQLPPNECLRVYDFLEMWADKATLGRDCQVTNPVGYFLLDLTADAPPLMFPRDTQVDALPRLRVLNATALASAVHIFITRLQKGETPKALDLGTECFGPACIDMLRRMVKSWGLSARRQFSRTKTEESFSVCLGVNALHFFTSGQRPFAPPDPAIPPAQVEHDDALDIDLALLQDDPDALRPDAARAVPQEIYRVEDWQALDTSATGVALSRSGEGQTHVRVGDLAGIADEHPQRWRVGVVRWLKSPHSKEIEIGIEMLAPYTEAVAIRAAATKVPARYTRALLLPGLAALKKPHSLLIAAGTLQLGQPLELLHEDRTSLIKATHLLERTAAFEHMVYVEITRPTSDPAAPASDGAPAA